ncbi:MAG: glycosyltransferase family 2 protein [Ruminococcaceae bacterium]|nr:glycosyltransferase family 2 protein [Oscillospiraceae bacterium]
MPTFSIIVPVYNSEKTLHRCLDSLKAQTYSDFEVRIVENGSVDSSCTICREYAEKDPRFLLHVNEGNCGPSGARNIGLDYVRGNYIAFLDSDDYVEPDYLDVLLRTIENTDVVFLGYHQVETDGRLLGDHIPVVKDGGCYYETLLQLSNQDMFGYTWVKVFRREIIGEHRFSCELNLQEDEVFTCEVMTQPCRVAVVPKAILNYVTGNSDSLIGRTHLDYCRKVDAAYEAWKKLLEHYEKKIEVLKQMANAHVKRCMFYGFERDLSTKAFFEDLAETTFFSEATLEDDFAACVKNHDYKKLARMRTAYRLKNKIAKLLKR